MVRDLYEYENRIGWETHMNMKKNLNRIKRDLYEYIKRLSLTDWSKRWSLKVKHFNFEIVYAKGPAQNKPTCKQKKDIWMIMHRKLYEYEKRSI